MRFDDECIHDWAIIHGAPMCIRCGEVSKRQREALGNVNDYESVHWQSDWNGDEVGWDHIPVVGLYDLTGSDGTVTTAYIDAESGDLLEVICYDQESDNGD